MGTTPISRGDLHRIRSILAELEVSVKNVMQRIPTKGILELGFFPDERDASTAQMIEFDESLASDSFNSELQPIAVSVVCWITGVN